MKNDIKQLIEEIEFYINLNDDRGIIPPAYDTFLCHLVDIMIDETFIKNKEFRNSIEIELREHLKNLHENFEVIEEEKEEFRYESSYVKTGKTYVVQKLVRKSQENSQKQEA